MFHLTIISYLKIALYPRPIDLLRMMQNFNENDYNLLLRKTSGKVILRSTYNIREKCHDFRIQIIQILYRLLVFVINQT